MALPTVEFTTGPATLPDVGNLAYNGCNFSPLFETIVSGNVVKDNANRTTRFMEYTIEVDGYVTMPDGDDSVNGVMTDLRTLLTAQGGSLTYSGRGMDLDVGPDTVVKDVAWGPIPELLEFQPLGAGRSAKVRWRVKVRIPEIAARAGGGNQRVIPGAGGLAALPLLQFNYETLVTYGEDGYSSASIRGTLEVAMTRTPDQKTRRLTNTVDDARQVIEARIMSGIDLTRFRVVKRDFNVSRDKRVMEWDWSIEEKGYMDLPPDCTVGRGTYSVRPAKAGMGLVTWLCTLRATYVVRHDRPRRTAWLAFLSLLRLRMAKPAGIEIPGIDDDQNPKKGNIVKLIGGVVFGPAFTIWSNILKSQDREIKDSRIAFLLDFSFDEGIYLDSKVVSFSATWRLNCPFSHILLASNLWVKLQENELNGNNLWATSVRDISGSKSWPNPLNRLDPALDVIVDFGGG